MSVSVLIVEDTRSLAALYENYLIPTGVKTNTVGSAEEAKNAISQDNYDLVLLDVMLPDGNGIDVLAWINTLPVKPQVIVVTAHGTKELIVESMQLGAVDFVEKPIEADRLRVTVNNALKIKRLEKKVAGYSTHRTDNGFCNMVGRSPAMESVYQIIQNAAPSKASVFITGESGTGKELCAEAIHQCSDRKSGNFVALNCAAIPKDLIESEIFGHVKGAFTGATSSRDGAAGQANGGTLFFDEICEMDINLQSKLLRFIQTGSFQKVGGEKLEQVNVRFVCATNRDPWEEVIKGNFREDLYYRLHVVPIHLPPLRQRDDDVVAIADALFRKISNEEGKIYKGLTSGAEGLIRNFGWPGNVRQLENTIRNVVVLNQSEFIDETMFPLLRDKADVSGQGGAVNSAPAVATAPASPQVQAMPSAEPNYQAPVTQSLPVANQFHSNAAEGMNTTLEHNEVDNPFAQHHVQAMWVIEKRYIEHAIALCNGNVSRAAGLLEINPSTIYRKMKEWGKSA